MNYISAHIPARLWAYEWIALILFIFLGNFFLRNTTENTINWCIEWFIIGKLCSGYNCITLNVQNEQNYVPLNWSKNSWPFPFHGSSVIYLNPFRCSTWKHFNAYMEKTENRQGFRNAFFHEGDTCNGKI